jgi:hypothetical protein
LFIEPKGTPVGEEQIGGDGVQVGEKVFACAQHGTALLPQLFHAVAHRMKGKRQQIQQHKQLRQMLFAMPEVMFQMIAMILQYVEALVFDLPAGGRARAQAPISATFSGVIARLVTKAPR